MGIEDNNRRKASRPSDDDIINLNDLFVKGVKGIVVLLVLLLCLRFPIVWVKFPAALIILVLGWRWIFLSGKKAKQKIEDQRGAAAKPTRASNQSESAIERYEAAVGGSPKPDRNAIRLLLAYDAAGEFGRAKTLIQNFDGKVFTEELGIEFAALAKNYFPVELEPMGDEVRFKLV